MNSHQKFVTDACFKIGSSHAVCEDYAACDESLAVLSDGCSSAKNTDIGARFLCRNALMEKPNDIKQLSLQIQMLGLPIESLFCTLLGVTVSEVAEDYPVMLEAGIYGDGFIIAAYHEPMLSPIVISHEYAGNMPWYPAYCLLDASKIQKPAPTITVMNSGPCVPEFEAFDDGCHSYSFDPATFRLVMVCSDGLGSFSRADGSSVSPLDLANDLCDVKVTSPQFMQRRVNALKRNAWSKFSHFDDFSVAAVICVDE